VSVRAAGIIAAGHGTRLKGAAPGNIKPLLEVGGKPLIHWVVSGLRDAGITRIVLLVNSSGKPVRHYVREQFPGIEWVFLTRDTASSWESFRLVSNALAQREWRFVISTTDALISPRDVSRFVHEEWADDCAGALALTKYVDDEKPLWADIDDAGRVTAIGPNAKLKKTVTCGLYGLGARVARDMPEAGTYGRLRDFWIDLIAKRHPIQGMVLTDSIDVDRPEDLAAAGDLTRSFQS